MSKKLVISELKFNEILNIINQARERAYKAVNKELINLYWQIGEYLSNKVQQDGWGKSTVIALSNYISSHNPDIKGFSAANIWRMKQFYEEYRPYPKLSTLLREISWSGNLHILSKTKSIKEKEFYIHLAIKEKYSVRELERQIDSGYYERLILSEQKLSTPLRELSVMSKTLVSEYKDAHNVFRDKYFFEFLDLPDKYTEKDFKKALLKNMRNFLLEVGKDFSFIGEEYRLQVGNKDFFIDLLFYHRDLQCLVVFEIKTDDFKPGYLGQLNFYLEALDRDVKKYHEKPSIGVLLCKTKDETVVEYSLSKSLSPALIAEYETKLIRKELLQERMNNIMDLIDDEIEMNMTLKKI